MNSKCSQTAIGLVFALVGFLLFASTSAQAEPKVLSISLTATYQAPDVISGTNQNITTSTTKQLKLTPATLITLIGANLSLTSTAGYKLIYDPISGAIGLTNGATQSFQDASALLSIETNGVSVHSGKANSDADSESESITTYTVITFNDANGTTFTLAGLLKDMTSQPPPTAAQANNGIAPDQTVSFLGNVIGYGSVVVNGNSDAAVFSGSISGGGTGPGT